MKKVVFLLAITLLFTSCISYVDESNNFYTAYKIPNNGEITLLSDSLYKSTNNVLIEIITQGDYQLLAPLNKLIKYVSITDDKKLLSLNRFTDSLVSYSQKHTQRILTARQFSLSYNIDFYVPELDFFKSGDFFIINKKKNTSVEKIFIEDKGYKNTPMIRGHEIFINIDKYVFWKIHILSNS